MIKKEWQANVLLFITSGIWGFAFIAQRVATRYIGALTFNSLRLSIGALSMLPILWFFRKRPTEGADAVPLRNTLLPGMILGCVLFVAATLQQVGINTTTAGKAGFITDLYIVLVPIAEVLFGRKLKKSIWICVVLAAAGLYLISVTGQFTISEGDFYELIGAFFWTAHIMLIDRYSKKTNAIKLSLIQYATAAVLSFIAASILGKFSLHGLSHVVLPTLFCGVLSVGIAYTLQIKGQRYSKPSHASIILSMESVFACLAGIFFLHENMGVRGYIGCALMICAMILTQFGGFHRKSSVIESI
jgi:drug/metabolite transporter (DMT)-like permease